MSLRSLPDEIILSRIRRLVRCERGMTLRVLDHVAEVERRKLHLVMGHSSMFDYCTRGLGYSESAAWRRIQSMRCLTKFPEVRAMLESNDINLSTLACVARVLTWENKADLLASIRGRSLSQVKAIVARQEPRTMPREVVRQVAVRTTPTPANIVRLDVPVRSGAPVLAGAGAACEKSDYCRSGSNAAPAMEESKGKSPSAPEPVELRTRLSFTASTEFMADLDRIKALAWHRLGASPSLERVFEMTMKLFLDRNDPIRRREHRAEREFRVTG